MTREILLGICIGLVLVYLYYLYLKWANAWSGKAVKYSSNPRMATRADADYLDSYGWALPPEPIADGFNVVNFWILYYMASLA